MRNESQKCVILDAVAARRSGPAFLLISLRKKLIFWSKDLVRYTLGHASQSDYRPSDTARKNRFYRRYLDAKKKLEREMEFEV